MLSATMEGNARKEPSSIVEIKYQINRDKLDRGRLAVTTSFGKNRVFLSMGLKLETMKVSKRFKL